MNNEPIAWMYRMKDSQNKWELIFNKPINDEFFETIPLYTHPAKTLTDEEISDIYWSLEPRKEHEIERCSIDFARAILRKAQEK